MQIQLKQPELEAAVRAYIELSGIIRPVGAISFTASRGTDGMVTEIEILPEEDADSRHSKATAPPEGKVKRAEKAQTVAKAKEPAKEDILKAIVADTVPQRADPEEGALGAKSDLVIAEAKSNSNSSGKSLFG